MKRNVLAALAVLVCLSTAACRTEDPAVAPSPSASPTASETASPQVSPSGDPLTLAEGSAGPGLAYQLKLVPGDPVCVQLRRLEEEGDFMVCDESSEQDFNGDDDLRYAFGGLNPEQVPKFVIGITNEDVARVVINLGDGPSPEVDTLASPAAPDRRFFAVMLDPEPAQHVLAVRGLDAAGKTVAGFSLGEPGEGSPSPLPTG
jgi:hypothetical protein